MKRKLHIYQYGSVVRSIKPTRYSPSDWLEFSLSDSSPSERSCSIGAPEASDSYASDASSGSVGHVHTMEQNVVMEITSTPTPTPTPTPAVVDAAYYYSSLAASLAASSSAGCSIM